MQGKLYVTAALDAEFGDDLERRGAQHLVFLVAERLAGRDNDRVAGVYADRVDVLHVADGDGVALAVAHNLIFNFLPARDVLLDQNFIDAGVHDARSRDFAQLVPGVGDATAGAAEGVRRTNDDRQANFLGKRNRVLDRVDDLGSDDRLADLLHGVLKHLAVFGLGDGGRVCAEKLYAHLVEEPFLAQLHGEVETGLAAKIGQQGIRTFFFDDFLNRLHSHWLNINLVGHGLVGHNGCRVGVDKDNLQTLFAQCAAGLRACIVELGRLANHDRAGSQHHNLLNIAS